MVRIGSRRAASQAGAPAAGRDTAPRFYREPVARRLAETGGRKQRKVRCGLGPSWLRCPTRHIRLVTDAPVWHAKQYTDRATDSTVTDSPSFKGLVPASEAASRTKRANRKKDTAVELLLRRKLWRMGLRYRTHAADLPGTPDLIFPTLRVAVFCDGDFWHGRNWDLLRRKLEQGTNASYWPMKIARNRERDLANDVKLTAAGWRVIRLWETDIKRDLRLATITVLEAVQERKQELDKQVRERRPVQVK